MRVILGIGNPGNRYQYNRHNIGFMLLDYFANTYSLSFIPSKSDYYYAKGEMGENPFFLIKPATYVNNSGIVAAEILNDYGVQPKELLVVHDDVNLELAAIKPKISGGDGGHNGLRSIIYHLSSNKFSRLRLGIGSSFEKGDMANYVLSDFETHEMKLLTESFKQGISLIEEFLKGGIKQMLDYNSLILNSNINKNLVN